MKQSSFANLLFRSLAAAAAILPPSDNTTVTVDLSRTRGASKHWGSGFIYGIPDTRDQIPDYYYEDMKFQYGRAGGAQMGAPNRGWIWGLDEYYGRLNSTLSNYFTCRKYGASFIILPHDVWGTDNANSSTFWPGDNGDWTDYSNFVLQLMSDMKARGATEGLVWDVWNEPDIGIFWDRPLQQWIDLYILTHKILRSDPEFDVVEISGPTLAFRPLPDNPWWTLWLDQIAGNDTVPDQYAYHLEGITTQIDNDLQYTNASLKALLETYNLPERQININEYANWEEQVPASAAWWLSRFERYDAWGLRGNWEGGTALHDLMANLLTKTVNAFIYNATDYVPAPEYPVYTYYATNMTGLRATTTGSTDRQFDAYATIDNKVRILAGSRLITGNWTVVVEHLDAVSLPRSGCVEVKTWAFIGTSVWDIVTSPVDLGISKLDYVGSTLVIQIVQNDTYTAYAFEFDV
ncbi:uncharacterized protein PAC_11883 [Phialocephala subalpina]|uniref:Glycoside hydrolase family 39 protein n=1 Tax=Phialocephala subalpina TaxID=576137 RepID=A0A1L7XAH8_9HELO|nr:uncharacterized protein PAC_11883 [Phialocephala subalpina]